MDNVSIAGRLNKAMLSDAEIQSELKSAGLRAIPLAGGESEWESVLQRVKYSPVAYQRSSLDFQFVYQQGHGGVWQDISLILLSDRNPVGIWPISLSEKEGLRAVTSQGVPLMPPLFISDISAASEKKIIKGCFSFLDGLARRIEATSIVGACSFADQAAISRWHFEAVVRGADCRVAYDVYLNLAPDMEVIKAGFRKSFKPLITTGLRLWQVRILDVPDRVIWDDFRKLHQKVAGRVTRVEQTWDIHLEDIARKRGFLVYLLNPDGVMEGAGFFNKSRDEGLYAVAAYNRELFDKPLGHVVQFHAIKRLKDEGVKWYKIGQRPLQTELPRPTAKEMAIGDFKQGFASHIFPRYVIDYKTPVTVEGGAI